MLVQSFLFRKVILCMIIFLRVEKTIIYIGSHPPVNTILTEYTFQNSKLLAPVVYFAEPVKTSSWFCLVIETCTVHLISHPDQPGRKLIYHYKREDTLQLTVIIYIVGLKWACWPPFNNMQFTRKFLWAKLSPLFMVE